MTKNITVQVVKDYDELSITAAKLFAGEVQAKPSGVFGFATGGTPEGMYASLIDMSKAGAIDLTKLTAFNLDEYFPIDPQNSQSYAYYMATKLFDAAGVPHDNRNMPSGTAACPTTECAQYEEKIRAAGGIDLQILGIGNNGHIGFNEPDSVFTSVTSHVALAEETTIANARYFERREDVPTHAISMGIKTIMMAKKILLLASGEPKAKILSAAINGPITPQVPASALQLHRDVTVIADACAAKYL